jgi:hypothetical protein
MRTSLLFLPVSLEQPHAVQDSHRQDEHSGHDEELAVGGAVVSIATRLPYRRAIFETSSDDGYVNGFWQHAPKYSWSCRSGLCCSAQ